MTLFTIKKKIGQLLSKPLSEEDRLKKSILNELMQEGNIINPHEILLQIINKDPLIQCNYKGDIIYSVNEPSTVYHLVKSISKIEKLVDAVDFEDCKTVLDIGSHVGLFSYFIKKKFPDAKIYLFEADKKLLPVIKKNLAKYTNWEITNIAVTDSDNAEINFYVNNNSTQTNSTIKEAVSIIEKEENIITEKITTITIDTFCKSKQINKVDVLKIDIQGGELAAFQQAHATLENTRILLAEASFFVSDTYDFLTLVNKYFKKNVPVNDVFMGADIKFYN